MEHAWDKVKKLGSVPGPYHSVNLCDAYHGWWNGVQPGIGSYRKIRDAYTLQDMSDAALIVLATRKYIACVLMNPLQALHHNICLCSSRPLASGHNEGKN